MTKCIPDAVIMSENSIKPFLSIAKKKNKIRGNYCISLNLNYKTHLSILIKPVIQSTKIIIA